MIVHIDQACNAVSLSALTRTSLRYVTSCMHAAILDINLCEFIIIDVLELI